MDLQVDDIVAISKVLISGLVAAWVYQSLVPVRPTSLWERLIQALIFTLFINIGIGVTRFTAIGIGEIYSIGTWNANSETIVTAVVAVAFGCISAFFTNNDLLHKYARKLKITTETSYTSEWYASFINNVTYVVIHLKDGRRILGWPREWPSIPGEGHFVIEDYSWLTEATGAEENSNKNSEIISNGEFILIPGEQVEFVEFMKIIKENEDVKKTT